MNVTLVSFLGIREYLHCRYTFGGKTSSLKPFVQEALIELISSSEIKVERVIILCTEYAKKCNWEDTNRYNGSGLKKRLSNIKPQLEIECLDIPEGQSEEELWKIFSILYEKIKPAETIYLDITHSYRSLPMLVIPFINYTRLLKDIKIGGIVYGAFESLGTKTEIESIPEEKRIAPIFNLITFDELLQWSNGINLFTNFGNANLIKDLIKEKTIPVLKGSKGKDFKYQNLENLATRLDKICKMISAVRGNRINKGKEFMYLKESIEKLSVEESIIPPLIPLLEILKKKADPFQRNSIENSFHAVNWCIEHGLLQQGITLFQENIITYILHKAELTETQKDDRELVSELFGKENWKKDLEKGEFAKINKIRNTLYFSDLAIIYNNLREYRNDINHAGFRDKLIFNEADFDEKLRESYTKLQDILKKEGI